MKSPTKQIIVSYINNKINIIYKLANNHSRKIHLQIEKISTTRLLISSIIQLILYLTFYKKVVANPGDVYDIAGWMTAIYIVLLLSICVATKEILSTIQEKIGGNTKNIFSLAFLVGIYFCSAVGSATLNDIFPFSSSNTRYALAVATFMIAGYVLIVAFTLFITASLFILFPYLTTFYKINNPQNKHRTIVVGIAIVSNIIMPFFMISITNNKNFTNFLYILVSRVAIDYDSMPATLCLDQKTINQLQGQNGTEYWVASIPVSTAVDTGYIVMALRKLPTNKGIKDYTEFDKYQYMPATLYKVSCDQRNNITNISDAY